MKIDLPREELPPELVGTLSFIVLITSTFFLRRVIRRVRTQKVMANNRQLDIAGEHEQQDP